MSNLIHAHLFGRKRRGDREEVKMRLFNPDGSPANFGGSSGRDSMILQGYLSGAESDVEVLNNSTGVRLPINEVVYISGFDVNVGDTEIEAPSGAYLFRLQINVNFPDSSPTSGRLVVGVLGEPSMNVMLTMEVNTWEMLTPDMLSMDILPEDGNIYVEAWQDTDLNTLSLSGRIHIVKL